MSPWFVLIASFAFPLNSLQALKMTEVTFGQSIILKCYISYHHEINWVRMGLDMKPETLMVMGLKNDGSLSISWNYNKSHFEGIVQTRFIGLKILQVHSSDLDTYLCAALNGKQIEFGEGMRLYTNQSVQQPNNHCSSQDSSEVSVVFTQTHLIIAVVLITGLLLMVLTIIIVHMKTKQRRATRPKKSGRKLAKSNAQEMLGNWNRDVSPLNWRLQIYQVIPQKIRCDEGGWRIVGVPDGKRI